MNLTNQVDFSNQHFYIGTDVHKKNWKITIRTSTMELKTFSMDSSADNLAEYMKKNYPNGVYHSVYEAGFSGYGAHKELTKHGFDSIIVSPADVPSTNKEKSGKTDKIDSRKLSRELANGSLSGIYIPDDYHQQLRSLCRMRQLLIRDETRMKNRIKSMFMFYSKEVPENKQMQHWSKRFIEWLRNQRFEFEMGNQCLSVMIDGLINSRSLITQVTKNLRHHCNSNPEIKKIIELLLTVPGIGFITAVTIYTEIINIKRFKTLDHFCSYIGLVPSVHSSGDKNHTNGLTKRANAYLRSLIIEASWTAIRVDPALTMKYNELIKNMKGQEAIIHIAKKLINRIRRVWLEEKPYVLSIVK